MDAKHLQKMFERINNDPNIIIDYNFTKPKNCDKLYTNLILTDEPEIYVNQKIDKNTYKKYKEWYTQKYNELEYRKQREISIKRQEEINLLLKILNYKFDKICELYFL